MKKKFYTWEECMQLREVKVWSFYHCDSFDLKIMTIVSVLLELKKTESSQYLETTRSKYSCIRLNMLLH